MAPVGRWQKNRDLSWYAKDGSPADRSAAEEARKEEIRRIKEAEQDALSEALGYAPMPKRNANEIPLGTREVERAVREVAKGGGEGEGGRGVGFGFFERVEEGGDVLRGEGMEGGRGFKREEGKGEAKRERKDRRDRSWDRDRERRRRRHDEERGHRRHRSRERSRDGHERRRERSRSYVRNRDDDRSPRRPRRSYSPDPHRRRRSKERDRDRRR